jgi:hypothetical protein
MFAPKIAQVEVGWGALLLAFVTKDSYGYQSNYDKTSENRNTCEGK